MTRPVVWADATRRLREDPDFGPLIERVGPVRLRPRPSTPFAALASSIIYQQLAGKAASTIHGRFVQVLGGDVGPEPVLAATDEALRGAGLSGNKIAAIRDLAAKSVSGEVRLDELERLDDTAVVECLTRVRGIGTWTAQMFLLFHLQRPDVWPVGDLGVRNGLGRVLGLMAAPSPAEMAWIGIGYRPWRSAVAWYAWRSLDPVE